MTVTNSTISNNSATSYGGLFVGWDAHLLVVNSTIAANVASNDMGGK